MHLKMSNEKENAYKIVKHVCVFDLFCLLTPASQLEVLDWRLRLVFF